MADKIKSYTSASEVYVGGELVKPGNPFFTADKPGSDWTEVTAKEAAAIEATTNPVPDDANLEAASKAALEAVAIMKHVPIVGLDKPALITAIKAAYEPKL